jgi:hypothetical protein
MSTHVRKLYGRAARLPNTRQAPRKKVTHVATRRRSRTVDQIERDAVAVEHRRRGLTYRQIAVTMGWKNQASAYEAVQRGLRDAIAEPADEVRQLELDRLDEYQRHALKVLATPHWHVSQGVVVVHPATEEPLTDDAPVLAALDRLLKISERRAKLLGLDAPVRSKVEVITEDAVDAEIKRLAEEVAEHDRQTAG